MCKTWFKKVGDRFMGVSRSPCTKSLSSRETSEGQQIPLGMRQTCSDCTTIVSSRLTEVPVIHPCFLDPKS